MNSDIRITFQICFLFAFLSLGEAFFLRWGSEPVQYDYQKGSASSPQAQSVDVTRSGGGYWGIEPAAMTDYSPHRRQQLQQPGKSWAQQSYRPQYSPYEAQQYSPPPRKAFEQISVPLQANLAPVALQHVQLVPCMCPVAPEEADRLLLAEHQGPYMAQAAQAAAIVAPRPVAQQQQQQMGAQQQQQQQVDVISANSNSMQPKH